jgi:plastocyanin
MRHALLAALLGATVVSAGCGGDDMAEQDAKTTRPAAAPTDTIRIKDFVFDPSAATVRTGQKIAVANDDAAPHTLTEQPASGKASFDTGTLRGRQTGSFVAAKPGTYKVFCELHPFMKGEIEVVR